MLKVQPNLQNMNEFVVISFRNLGAEKEKGYSWTDLKLGAGREYVSKHKVRILKDCQGS